MISILACDENAEGRTVLVDHISASLQRERSVSGMLPPFTVTPIAPEEIQFRAAADLLVVGQQLGGSNINFLVKARKQLPKAFMVVSLPQERSNILQVELLTRNKVDEVVFGLPAAELLVQRLLQAHSRVQATCAKGQLIVVLAGKGGVGVTSIVAALGEAYADRQLRTILVDLDHRSQTLSRFLRVSPCLNEPLQLLVEGSMQFSEEAVRESWVPVWSDIATLQIVPPVSASQLSYFESPETMHGMMRYFEYLDRMADVVLVDAGTADGIFLDNILRIADQIVVVVGNDPAALFGSVDCTRRVQQVVGDCSRIHLLEYRLCRYGLSSHALRREFLGIVGNTLTFLKTAVPEHAGVARWPGSQLTPYSCAGRGFTRIIAALAADLRRDLESSPVRDSYGESLFSRIVGKIMRRRPTTEATLGASRAVLTTEANQQQKSLLPVNPHLRMSGCDASPPSPPNSGVSCDDSLAVSKHSSRELVSDRRGGQVIRLLPGGVSGSSVALGEEQQAVAQ